MPISYECGEVLAEASLTGTINEEYIFFNGERIARVDRPSGTVHYYFSDHLGSASVITDASGNVQQNYHYFPFGGFVATTISDPNHYDFTGKERDSESCAAGSCLDNFGARYYKSNFGRFMTPDAKLMTSRHLGSPQKWNKYAYVQNNPLMRLDPDGLDDYIVFRYAIDTRPGPNNGQDMMGRKDTKQWAAVKAKIESTTDAKGRPNTFHMMEGSEGPNKASVENWTKAENTPDAHVTFIGHTGFDQNGNPGIELSNGTASGQIGDSTWNVDPSSPFLFATSGSDPVSASSISIFGCNSYDLGSQYPNTDFTGVQGNVDLNTAEGMGLAATSAMGGQAGASAANDVIQQSGFQIDTGADVEFDPQ